MTGYLIPAGNPYFLRLLKLSPFERRSGGWRFGTKRIADTVVARLIASGAATREGDFLHPAPMEVAR